MSSPSVCAILLTADRPEMTRQAVECFRRQTYHGKSKLVVWDTSSTEDTFKLLTEDIRDGEYYLHDEPLVIGQLRNRANSYATSREGFEAPDILIHLDSDDHSHANRFAEQVHLLESSGADCVGYREMLFWREPHCEVIDTTKPGDEWETSKPGAIHRGEAWLYSNANPHYALGTSLCYWRHVWERKPFEDTSQGEDEKFIRGLNVAAVSSLACGNPAVAFGQGGPAMIARIHSSNTSTAYDPRKMEQAHEWRRVAEWDKYCQGVFA